MDAKHTPGPWHSVGGLVITGCVHGEPLCKVFQPKHGGDGEANSRLIAAAPALLRELERWVAWADRNPAQVEGLGAIDRVRGSKAAIALAESRP